MEDVVKMKDSFGSVYSSKKVFVTGHTGFKGSWICEWLLALGAKVTGYALPPDTSPSLFTQLELGSRLEHIEGDIRHQATFAEAFRRCGPDFVFHLAAQPLVRESYRIPVETFDTNVMGTVHLLNILRDYSKRTAVVFVTTDKCYENKEWVHGYREEDPLGGYDPYSASKGAAEIAINSFRRSFFEEHPVKIASARAGNVVGGGDWAADRIIPDCVRALQNSKKIAVRNKVATRPWQHVLEPLSGYLWLGASLYNPDLVKGNSASLTSAFNFGPGHESNRTVKDLVVEVMKHWKGDWEDRSDPKALHEAKLLQLSTDKASALLGWEPTWNFPQTIEKTIEWYQKVGNEGKRAQEFTTKHLQGYTADAEVKNLAWAKKQA
ncbi:MAG: CDP-glucose 4,6-dehydratase [Verrucomicrobiales bacterium]|nr:CDP-glucose 4,6-dehydratase [Verrucomicrobiales bacterium]